MLNDNQEHGEFQDYKEDNDQLRNALVYMRRLRIGNFEMLSDEFKD